MTFYKMGQGGFVKLIIIIVIALIVLGYFGFNVADIIKSPTVDSNLSWGKSLVLTVWNNFLKAPVIWIWDNVVIGLGWNGLQKLKNSIGPIDEAPVDGSFNTNVPEAFRQ